MGGGQVFAQLKISKFFKLCLDLPLKEKVFFIIIFTVYINLIWTKSTTVILFLFFF